MPSTRPSPDRKKSWVKSLVKMRFQVILALLSLWMPLACWAGNGTLYTHNETFVPDYILRVTAQNYSQLCSTRYTALANGTSPGPELRLTEGKTTWIRVYNDMPDANLTMHWHGLTMVVAPFSDGSPAASQWPIAPAHFFDYEVHPEVGYAGSYFYHSHVGFQAVSVTGALIIEEPAPARPPYDYDDERTLMLTDFFTMTDAQINAGLISTNFSWSGETLGMMINGQGRNFTNATGSCKMATIEVAPDTTYRFRFIGATALSFISLAFQDHADLTIIEADGQYTKPSNVSFLQVATGQRYDVLFRTKSAAQVAADGLNGQYWIQMTTLERPTNVTTMAILHYTNMTTNSTLDLTTVPEPPPLPLAGTVSGWLDYVLSPLVTPTDFPTADEVTRRVLIRMHQNITMNATDPDYLVWLQGGAGSDYNGLPWTAQFPTTPYLVQIYENMLNTSAVYDRALPNNWLDPVTRLFAAKKGEVLEVVLQNQAASNGGTDTHPWHAHGGHYWDIGGGSGTYNATLNEARLNGTTPVKRDTTVLYRYTPQVASEGIDVGWRAWRIRVEDVGVWMIHCHIIQHMLMGMQTVWVMGDREDILEQAWPVYSQGYLQYGGNAYGNSTHWPRCVHYFDDN